MEEEIKERPTRWTESKNGYESKAGSGEREAAEKKQVNERQGQK